MSDNPSRAGFDWRRFATDLRRAVRETELPYRRLADEIGVTLSDLSRATGGTNVSVEKVIALCEFMRRDVTDFYQRPMKSTRFTAPNVKHAHSPKELSP